MNPTSAPRASGGINLEDIAHPRCFRVLAALRSRMAIPVWHDDQQGTAVVVLAGIMNALTVVGKSMASARIALIGAGAANVAVFHPLQCAGVLARQIIARDSGGVLHRGGLTSSATPSSCKRNGGSAANHGRANDFERTPSVQRAMACGMYDAHVRRR